jgi:cell fate regulator YaaT (PSP1 superfamily)
MEYRQVYRKAKPADVDKWKEAIALEHETMIKSRKLSEDLKLDMKIGDVEYQGDKTKAIFYYIADERVDFRELIKVLAENFRIRIEMRQIGARQEAGRIGGIGSCGRELCCSTWIRNFVSVTTTVARNQELSLNPQKLAGQCGKLKCCLNYEVETYMDVRKRLPSQKIELETKEGRAFHQKTDIFKGIMWYSFSLDSSNNLVPVNVERVKEIIELNRKGVIVEKLNEVELEPIEKELGYMNPVGQESLTRFDSKKSKNKKKDKNKSSNNRRNNPNRNPKK